MQGPQPRYLICNDIGFCGEPLCIDTQMGVDQECTEEVTQSTPCPKFVTGMCKPETVLKLSHQARNTGCGTSVNSAVSIMVRAPT
jgi:hypothetical protein